MDTILEKILGSHTFVQCGVTGERCSRRRWTRRHHGIAGILSLSRSLCSLPFGSSRLNLRHFTISATQATFCGNVQACSKLARRAGFAPRQLFWKLSLLFTPTFFFCPLGLIAKPFGAPGLLFVLAASVGAAYFWASRILRLLGVDGRVAIIAAGALLISPLSVAFYQEVGHGISMSRLFTPRCV